MQPYRQAESLEGFTHLLYKPVGFDLKQVQRARKNALKLVTEATELSPGLDRFRESFRAIFASFGFSPTGLYSKRVCTVRRLP